MITPFDTARTGKTKEREKKRRSSMTLANKKMHMIDYCGDDVSSHFLNFVRSPPKVLHDAMTATSI